MLGSTGALTLHADGMCEGGSGISWRRVLGAVPPRGNLEFKNKIVSPEAQPVLTSAPRPRSFSS